MVAVRPPVPTAPQPAQPAPTEIAQWQATARNARQQYMDTVARNQYGKQQATLAYQTGLQNLNYNQGQQRQGFDDPYIGRGIFNSGIRGQGLTNFYTQQGQQFTGLQNQYAGQMGGYDIANKQAMSLRDQYLRNAREAEQARRQQLAAQIQGII